MVLLSDGSVCVCARARVCAKELKAEREHFHLSAAPFLPPRTNFFSSFLSFGLLVLSTRTRSKGNNTTANMIRNRDGTETHNTPQTTQNKAKNNTRLLFHGVYIW